MKYISSPHNPRVKQAIKLRERRTRAKHGATLIDGTRELNRAVTARVEIVELFVCPELCSELAASLAHQIKHQTETMHVSRSVFEKLAFGDRQEGIVAVARATPRRLADWNPPPQPLIGVLDSLEKPGNVGAVLRTADGAGVTAIIVTEGGTDLFNPNVIRASLGTVFTVPVFAASSEECFDWLKKNNIAVYAARVEAERLYTQVNFSAPSAVLLGSEAKGLGSVWARGSVTAISLPMLGVADSLNVSATAAVLFYEALRQRSNHASRRQSQ